MDIEKIKNLPNSAYRSMLLSKAKANVTQPKTKNKGDLKKWRLERWVNLNALRDKNLEIPCGQKYPNQTTPTVCRPMKRINKTTPTPLAYELTNNQITKAIKQKEKGQRINWKDLIKEK